MSRDLVELLSSDQECVDAGPGAVNFIIDHAELEVVFVQDKKVKEVRNKYLDLHFYQILYSTYSFSQALDGSDLIQFLYLAATET